MSAASVSVPAVKASPALLLMSAVSAAVLLLYAPTVSGMIELWLRSEHQHGALVLPTSAYLLWRARASLASAKLAPWWPGLVPVASLVLVWWVARSLDVKVVEQLAVMLMIPAAICAVLGRELCRRALFPLLFLVAAVPMGEGILPYLMRITADISTALLRLTGVPVFREGQYLSLPNGNFLVADVCAGLNYLVAGLMIATLFAYLTYRSNVRRLVFVAITAVTLIAANGVRAFVVMYVASASNLKYLAGRDHIWFGWLLFGLVIIGLFLLGGRWAERQEDAARDDRQRPVARVREVFPLALVLTLVLLAATAQRFQAVLGSSWKLLLPAGALLLWVLFRHFGRADGSLDSADGHRVASYGTARSAALVGGAILILSAGPLLTPRPEIALPAGTVSFQLADVSTGCTAEPGAERAPWQQSVRAADFAAAAVYDCAGVPMRVVVAGFWGTRPEAEVHLLVPYDWRYTPSVRKTFSLPDGRRLAFNELRLRGRLVWYWYRIGDRVTSSPAVAKLFLGFEALTSSTPISAVYMVETMAAGPESEQSRIAEAARLLVESHPPTYPWSARVEQPLAGSTGAKDGPSERE